ncbi:HTH-type transcriptional repressor YtrA [Pirellulimonas nuda]|uniref:HTH-type transcriptional repressor YtrA n=1 Tax=Pirellulimonas nuda TaxID=2528009 RepID=A0A518DJI9_9BACT|nr:GntR family transcriptional regulator [Pirellulimonas nuda]QDU91638.1 HTH-type transcriptional repressor YtrA [Pirellulimonas nuda]
MLLRIEKGSAVPISRQLVEQVATHVAAGRLKPGARLPSVRELARELAVNQNTILRVYERLTADGLLERRQGQGTFVAESLPRRRPAAHRDRLIEELRQLIRQAQGLGMSAEQLHSLLDEALEQVAHHEEHEEAQRRRKEESNA